MKSIHSVLRSLKSIYFQISFLIIDKQCFHLILATFSFLPSKNEAL